jgi:glycosyltransferase involved in cell wall biosynthesis
VTQPELNKDLLPVTKLFFTLIAKPKVVVIIPAFNEENSIAKVVKDLPANLVDEVIVVNNNSDDATDINATNAGATVLHEERSGYGFACLKGIEYIKQLQPAPGIVVFIDADYSDHPEELPLLVEPIITGGMDMVIGSRALGKREKGSMTFQQIFGNWLATGLLKYFYNVKYTDLGPFRAIRFDKLLEINMQDTTYGWTVEMQIKAAKLKLKTWEVPVSYRKRIGFSKISGTVKGTLLAGYKIITTIFKYR